jgi:MoaA/NifB/PqqE/SkfB family radical SAM enzyme
MGASAIKRLLDELADVGCLRVSFSGGEPLLHPDIAELVDYCAELGMAPELNSCGTGFGRLARGLRRLRLLKISVDGPEEIHDRQRGRAGSYREAVEALKFAREEGIRTVAVTTLTRENVGHIGHVLDVARTSGAFAAFQPLKPYYKGCSDVEDLLPEPGEMRRAVRDLDLFRERTGGRILRNSAVALRHISRWPEYPPLRCWAGRVFCIIGADGTLYPCDRVHIDTPLPNCLDTGLCAALDRLPDPACDGCGFLGSFELNQLLMFNWRIAPALLRLIGWPLANP